METNEPVKRPTYLDRRKAAQHLEATCGVPVARATLAKLAVHGGGPAFRRFGKSIIYDVEDLDSWAKARMSARVQSNSGLGPDDPFCPGRGGRPKRQKGADESIAGAPETAAA